MALQPTFVIVVISVLVVGMVLVSVILHRLSRQTSQAELFREDAETARRTLAVSEAGIATTMPVRASATRQ